MTNALQSSTEMLEVAHAGEILTLRLNRPEAPAEKNLEE
jgi:hypothetical protein